jgi:hypothetical protein
MAYTFKDDGSSLTYYREYNKEVGTGDKTLVGNWVEERALREELKGPSSTGRYKHWVNTSKDPLEKQKTFTKFTTRPDIGDTYQRVFTHSEYTPPSEYLTSNQVPPPGYAVYVKKGQGARAALLEQRARELSTAVAHADPVLPPQYQTTNRQDFVPKDLPPGETLGRRVMMTQNMVDIKGAGDGLWRKEAHLIPSGLVMESTGAMPGFAMTMHGYKPQYGFGKDASFSTPIELYLKGEEKD